MAAHRRFKNEFTEDETYHILWDGSIKAISWVAFKFVGLLPNLRQMPTSSSALLASSPSLSFWHQALLWASGIKPFPKHQTTLHKGIRQQPSCISKPQGTLAKYVRWDNVLILPVSRKFHALGNWGYMSPVKRICVFEHSVMTNFICACLAIQRGQGSGFLSEGSSWLTACMSEQWRFWRDCADAQACLNLRCSHRR